MKIAIAYDCLYPYTIGGAERWYRSLAEHLARRHLVTFITRRQWRNGEKPDGPRGVRLEIVSGGRGLYTASGRRRILPPVRFGMGLLAHLLRHRHRYDVVHTGAFPYFSFLAARIAQALGGPPVLVDWFEVWSRQYWRDYLGGLRGAVGAKVQHACIAFGQHAFVFSELFARRLKEEGYHGDPAVLRGMYEGSREPLDAPLDRDPLVIFAGRHIREKRVLAIPAAIALARRQMPELRALIFGDGPERAKLLEEINRLAIAGAVQCPGFVAWESLDKAMRQACCLLMPSAREGYGLIVAEAAARSTPAIVVRGPDNAAIEMVADGENGMVLDDAAPESLARAIIEIRRRGRAMIQSTREWFRSHAAEISMESSVVRIEQAYLEAAQRPSRQ